MILAEKIMLLRKKNGWSQEELAEQLQVSRQSVSKWESAQSIPDLNKILAMSRLFSVSTDYLLKDNEEEAVTAAPIEEMAAEKEQRFVSMEEANLFLQAKWQTAPRIALGTSLCILSPIPLLLLPSFCTAVNREQRLLGFTEDMAAALGLIFLLLLVTVAVFLFQSCRHYTADFDYLDSEEIETAYGVISMVQQRKAAFRDRYYRNNLLGTCLCVLSALPLFVSILLMESAASFYWSTYSDFIEICGLCLTLVVVAVAVHCFVWVGIVWESYLKLLQEGEYSQREKQNKRNGLTPVYWSLVTAIYLLLSFTTKQWGITWLVWLFATPLYRFLQFVEKNK